MSRLSTELCSILTNTVLESLKFNKIYTTLQFLSELPENIVKMTNLTYKETLTIRKHIIQKHSSTPKNGLSYYNKLIADTAIITTNIKSLDVILDGGFITTNMYEICGVSNSGKTQLCLTIGVNLSQMSKQSVLYIDSKRDFSGKKLDSILKARGCTDDLIEIIMKDIKVVYINDVYELMNILNSMNNSLLKEVNLRMIIIDSLPAIFHQMISNSYCRGILNNVSNTIKYLAKKYQLVIIVVNIVTRWIDYGSSIKYDVNKFKRIDKPSLGKYWKHIPHTRLLISKTNADSEQRNIVVLKSTRIECFKTCHVDIDDTGVK